MGTTFSKSHHEKNCGAIFTLFFLTLGALRGFPAEGEAEKPYALERGGDFPSLLHYDIILKYTVLNNKCDYFSVR
jgi:hypothetical protein